MGWLSRGVFDASNTQTFSSNAFLFQTFISNLKYYLPKTLNREDINNNIKQIIDQDGKDGWTIN